MKRSARLTLKKETLAPLGGEELRVVAGASAVTCRTCLDCVEYDPSLLSPTNCCAGIPTFHRAAC